MISCNINFSSLCAFRAPRAAFWNGARAGELVIQVGGVSSDSGGLLRFRAARAVAGCRHTGKHEVEVPIRPFLGGKPFDPEKIGDMSKALEAVCEALQLRMIDDAATRLVAEKIVELAQRGIEGADRLCAMALQELKPSD